jgi:pimeloyl-ACP methyl ester carboxylesterase
LGEKLRSLISPGDWGIVKWQHRVFSGGPNLDLPCHGNNKCSKTLSIESCAKYIYNKIQDITDDFVFVGYSDGANIIMNLISSFKINVNNAVLISPTISWKGMKLWLRAIIKFTFYITFLNPFLVRVRKRMLMMINYNYDGKNLSNIPITLLFAQEDVVTIEEQEEIEKITNSKKIVIENTTHFNIFKNRKTLEIISLTTAST